ncbi:flavin-dependent quinone reductase [Martiniozyma asiatica (nom. inval.)]|nr:flavin-dependent quinone reductase [Martiniozyma asiatica]
MIGIIVGSTRANSASLTLANHLLKSIPNAKLFTPLSPYPLLTIPINSVPPLAVTDFAYEDKDVRAFSQDVRDCEAFIFISPVYNHSYSGHFKIIMDHLFLEFVAKDVLLLCLGFGGPGAGLEQMDKLANKFKMNVVDTMAVGLKTEYQQELDEKVESFASKYK